MKDVNRRLDKIEKQLSVGKKPEVLYMILGFDYPEGTTPYDTESYQEWETYKAEVDRAVEISKETGLGFVLFEVDPFREYEVRHNLPEGILSKHKHAGKIPFYLLAKATKIDQQQPNDKAGIVIKW